MIQPQIQQRTVQVHPFVVLVSVLFGATLLGVPGALVAIPVAASIQIALREWWDYRADDAQPPPASGPAAPRGPVSAGPAALTRRRRPATPRRQAAADTNPATAAPISAACRFSRQLPPPVGDLRPSSAGR